MVTEPSLLTLLLAKFYSNAAYKVVVYSILFLSHKNAENPYISDTFLITFSN